MIPVILETIRIDQATFIVTIKGGFLIIFDALRDVCFNLIKQLIFGCEITRSVRGVNRFIIHLMRNKGMPKLQAGPTLRFVDAN